MKINKALYGSGGRKIYDSTDLVLMQAEFVYKNSSSRRPFSERAQAPAREEDGGTLCLL